MFYNISYEKICLHNDFWLSIPRFKYTWWGRAKIIEILEKKYQLIEKKIIPDDEKTINKTLKDFINYEDLDLIVTTGGTGVSARDVTPEATKSLLEKEIPGVSELIRSEFYKDIKTSVLYRGLCGIANNKLILNLPGSPQGVQDGLSVSVPLFDHIFNLISGNTKH